MAVLEKDYEEVSMETAEQWYLSTIFTLINNLIFRYVKFKVMNNHYWKQSKKV